MGTGRALGVFQHSLVRRRGGCGFIPFFTSPVEVENPDSALRCSAKGFEVKAAIPERGILVKYK